MTCEINNEDTSDCTTQIVVFMHLLHSNSDMPVSRERFSLAQIYNFHIIYTPWSTFPPIGQRHMYDSDLLETGVRTTP